MEHDEVRALEVDLLDTWPGLEAHAIGGWRLSAAAGVTGRANSVTVLDANERDLDRRIDEVEAWYRQRHLPPRFRLTPISETHLAPRLEARGYCDRNGLTDTLVLAPLDIGASASSAVQITSRVDLGWWALTERPADQHATLAEMLAPLGDQVGYATLRQRGRPVAVGTAMVSGPRATVANLHTQPAGRNQGHGRLVLDSLHRWARHRGATGAFLNVMRDNEPAQRLYQSAGYRLAYSYRYLQAPT